MSKRAKSVWKAIFSAALMAGSALVPAAVHAQDGATVEERLERLEAMIGRLEARMDAADASGTAAASAENVAIAQEMRAAVAETRAAAQQQDRIETRLAAVEEKDAQGFRVGQTQFTLGGYVKLDAISQRTSGGQVPGDSINRDFLIPSLIPVGGDPSDWDTHFHARQSRVILKGETPVGDKTLGGLLELDFLVTDGGDQRVSNSYLPRMRQAYITYGGWTFGQAWSTFQNVAALPDSVDFVGTMPGTVFNRQAMIRYRTNSGISIAVEQPETTITNETGTRILPSDDQMPDLVLRYDRGGFAVAGILRQFHASGRILPQGGDSAFGYGVSVSGKIALGERDDLRVMATAGEGLGRYMGANIVNDAAIDANGNLDPIPTYAGFAAFRHVWSDRLHSTIAGSYFKADNPVDLTGTGPTDNVWNALANLIYSPVPKLDLGLEYMYAERENEAGASGNLQKIQASAKYSF
ncbi:DcaP family trimeric outer membrane transporter [Croceicoccus marinus]|jgi:hypothetical protein|nr:DcaP family trimeric outer membrane transporter [Croceicoccus marinus]